MSQQISLEISPFLVMENEAERQDL